MTESKRQRRRKRPSVRQLRTVKLILGNGWGDGDFLQSCSSTEDRRHTQGAFEAFNEWVDALREEES